MTLSTDAASDTPAISAARNASSTGTSKSAGDSLNADGKTGMKMISRHDSIAKLMPYDSTIDSGRSWRGNTVRLTISALCTNELVAACSADENHCHTTSPMSTKMG